MTRRITRRALMVGVLLAAVAGRSAAQSALPGGANELRETHGDWTVSCALSAEQIKTCAMSQEQFDAKTRQRLLAVELHPAGTQDLAGFIVMPFGLQLQAGARWSIDVAVSPDSSTLSYSTCLPGGCLLPLTLDAGTLSGLRAGQSLQLQAEANAGGTVDFAISLAGFSSALDRLVDLLR